MPTKKAFGENIMVQVAVAVPDIELAAKRLADIFGMEVPKIYDLSTNVDKYKGKITKSYVKTCYFPMGQVDLELIQPVGDEIAAAEFLKKNNGPGIQHISFMVDDLDEACKYVESKGLKVIQLTDFHDGLAAFANIPEIGADIELLKGSSKPDE
jgi:4-hydroxyphenylpyruvate dioxygenase-like putative hemolysin